MLSQQEYYVHIPGPEQQYLCLDINTALSILGRAIALPPPPPCQKKSEIEYTPLKKIITKSHGDYLSNQDVPDQNKYGMYIPVSWDGFICY